MLRLFIVSLSFATLLWGCNGAAEKKETQAQSTPEEGQVKAAAKIQGEPELLQKAAETQVAATQLQGNQPPVVTITQVSATAGGGLQLTFDLADAEGDASQLSLWGSTDQGETFRIPLEKASSSLQNINPGTGLSLTWQSVPKNIVAVKLVANDGQTFNITGIAQGVNAARLKQNIENITGTRHYKSKNDRPHLLEVQGLLENSMKQTGGNVYTQKLPFKDGYTLTNYMVRKEGASQPDEVLLIGAHYDAVVLSPGADDNASGLGSMLEAMLAITGVPLQKTVKFIGFDQEETGMHGSLAFVNKGGVKWFENVLGLINVDMIGYINTEANSQQFPPALRQLYPKEYAWVEKNQFKGDFLLGIGNEKSRALLQAFTQSANKHVPELKVLTLEVPGNGQSLPELRRGDHGAFWDRNYAAIMLGDGADSRHPYYHSPGDELAILDFKHIEKTTQALVATILDLAGTCHCGISYATVSKP